MAVTFSTLARNEVCSLVNGLSNAGEIVIYDGADLTGNVLLRLTLTNPAFQTPSSGSMTANPVAVGTAIASGTATSWGLYTSASHVDHPTQLVIQGTIGVSGSGADMILDTTTILVNQTTAITNFSFVAPL